jgi:hypothetical protein
MRLLLLYLRSRRVPAALAVAVSVVAAVWWIDQLTDHRMTGALGLLAVVAGAAAAGPGLAGHDVHLDRTAAIGWPPRRMAHLFAAGGIVIGLVAATALTGDRLAPAGEIVRDTGGMVGLLALGAVMFGGGRAWIPPLTWTLASLTALRQLWPPAPDAPTYQHVLTWMLQPAESTSAGWTAAGLAVTGILAYAIAGPRASSV